MSEQEQKLTARGLSDWLGYMSHKEIDSIQSVAKLLPPNAVVVKIGAGAGTDSLAILEVTNAVTIFSVDIVAGEDPINTNEHLRMAEAGYGDTGHVIRIWGDSKIAGKRWPYPIDFLFIDGDHSFSGCLGDITVWARKVNIGGYMAFHDVGSNNWPDVQKAITAFMDNNGDWEPMPELAIDTFRAYHRVSVASIKTKVIKHGKVEHGRVEHGYRV